MAMKEYSTYHRAPELVPHHLVQLVLYPEHQGLLILKKIFIKIAINVSEVAVYLKQ